MSILQDLKTYIKMQNIYLLNEITDKEGWERNELSEYLDDNLINASIIKNFKKDIKKDLLIMFKKMNEDIDDLEIYNKINIYLMKNKIYFELDNDDKNDIITDNRSERNNKFDSNKCMARIWQQNKLYKTGTGGFDNIQCNFKKSFNCELCKKHQKKFDENKLYCGFINKSRPEPLFINKKRAFWIDESDDYLIINS
jgi:hypothetical protein